MIQRKEETASFLIRFRQMIYENESGESNVQWRGQIRHVQGGEEQRFSEFSEVVEFVQDKLSELTLQAMEDKTPEEQKNILSKSLDLWKKVASTAPKRLMETIKDPKAQVAHIQEQIQEQIHEVGESIGQKLDIDVLKRFTGQDYEEIMDKLNGINSRMEAIENKIDALSKSKKK